MKEQLITSVKAFGQAVKRYRKLKKISQSEAGEPFRISQKVISSVESGVPGTQIETVFRILAALDLELYLRPKESSEQASEEK
jgi:HTH-type transcriptional regulator/antitoxin HipB